MSADMDDNNYVDTEVNKDSENDDDNRGQIISDDEVEEEGKVWFAKENKDTAVEQGYIKGKNARILYSGIKYP